MGENGAMEKADARKFGRNSIKIREETLIKRAIFL